jgi:hypothetical protein
MRADELNHLKPPPLSWNTVTMSEVRTRIELKDEARGKDAKLRKESEGGCPVGFRSYK